MKTQHIKFKDYNIVVSDEEIKDEELYLVNNIRLNNEIRIAKENKKGNHYQKIIASTNPEHNLPSINYNGLEEKFGIVDVNKIIEKQYGIPSNKNSVIRVEGFKSGFNYSQSINDKKYSLNDVEHLEFLFNRLKNVHSENENYDYMIRFKEIIQSLQQPKVTDVEIEMKNNFNDVNRIEDIENPKITNNQIKILKNYGNM